MERKIIFFIIYLFIITIIFAEEKNPDEEFIDVKLKEIHLKISPRFKLILPDTSLNLGLKHQIGNTTLEGYTEYNYIYSKVKYLLKYTLNIFMPVSFSLYDNIEFEKIFENEKYIQRLKGFSLSLKTPEIFNLVYIEEILKNESFYFAKLYDNIFNPDTGNILLLDTVINLFLTNDKGEKIFNQLTISFEKGIPTDYNKYNFLVMDFKLLKNIVIEKKQNINFDFLYELGYLIDKKAFPSWKIYYLGGYERLVGYRYDEFAGNYKSFIRWELNFSILNNINMKFFWIKWNNVDGFILADVGSVGSFDKIKDIRYYNAGMAIGIKNYFKFRNIFNVKITLAFGQALKSGYLPTFYFLYEI